MEPLTTHTKFRNNIKAPADARTHGHMHGHTPLAPYNSRLAYLLNMDARAHAHKQPLGHNYDTPGVHNDRVWVA
jgi:hypothetical protein